MSSELFTVVVSGVSVDYLEAGDWKERLKYPVAYDLTLQADNIQLTAEQARDLVGRKFKLGEEIPNGG